jgi:hypothetical protein
MHKLIVVTKPWLNIVEVVFPQLCRRFDDTKNVKTEVDHILYNQNQEENVTKNKITNPDSV